MGIIGYMCVWIGELLCSVLGECCVAQNVRRTRDPKASNVMLVSKAFRCCFYNVTPSSSNGHCGRNICDYVTQTQ